MNNTPDHAKELLSLRAEIESLKATIAMAVEQMKDAIKLFLDNPCKPEPTTMEAEPETSLVPTNHHQTQPATQSPDLSAITHDLKHELAAFVNEMRTLFQQEKRTFIPFQLSPMPPMPT